MGGTYVLQITDQLMSITGHWEAEEEVQYSTSPALLEGVSRLPTLPCCVFWSELRTTSALQADLNFSSID